MPIPVKPIRQQLTLNGQKIGCTDTCLAMLGNAQALAGLHLTELIVRHASGEWPPDPDSPGLNQRQLVHASTLLHFEYADLTGQSWARFETNVRARRLVIVQLWYSIIGGSAIGHAVLVTGTINGQYAYVDPMVGRLKTTSPATLRRAMAEFARRAGDPPGALRFGASRRVPNLA